MPDCIWIYNIVYIPCILPTIRKIVASFPSLKLQCSHVVPTSMINGHGANQLQTKAYSHTNVDLE